MNSGPELGDRENTQVCPVPRPQFSTKWIQNEPTKASAKAAIPNANPVATTRGEATAVGEEAVMATQRVVEDERTSSQGNTERILHRMRNRGITWPLGPPVRSVRSIPG